MVASSLVESVAAGAIQAVALAAMTASLANSAHLAGQTWSLHARMASRQQVEALLESWTARAVPPARTWAVRDAGPHGLRIEADVDGDGAVERESEEVMRLLLAPGRAARAAGVRAPSPTLALRHGIGKQWVTVAEDIESGAVFVHFDVDGRRVHGPEAVRLVRVPLTDAPLLVAVPVALEHP